MGTGPIVEIADQILGIILLFPKLLLGLALVAFFYGIYGYAYGVGEKEKKAARDTMVYGVIGLFVMVSVWGLVNLVLDIFGLGEPAVSSLDEADNP